MKWRIELTQLAQKQFDKMESDTRKRIAKVLFERVALLDDPRSVGQALKGSSLGDLWKYRVGDYRVIATIEDSTVRVLVVRIGNRKEVYR